MHLLTGLNVDYLHRVYLHIKMTLNLSKSTSLNITQQAEEPSEISTTNWPAKRRVLCPVVVLQNEFPVRVFLSSSTDRHHRARFVKEPKEWYQLMLHYYCEYFLFLQSVCTCKTHWPEQSGQAINGGLLPDDNSNLECTAFLSLLLR